VEAEDVPSVVAAGHGGAGTDDPFPLSVVSFLPSSPLSSPLCMTVRQSRHGPFPLQVFIDFGLAEQKATVEDKGVDLYVLERAIVSGHTDEEAEGFVRANTHTHMRITYPCIAYTLLALQFGCILESYFARVTDTVAIRRKFEQVRTRGRKRLAFG
jgi:hypothetical protein